MSAFKKLDSSLINTYGEAALGHPLPIFHPDTVHEEVDGILSQSARAEETVPGVAARLFVRLSDFVYPPERRDAVEVRGVLYSIEDIRGDDIDSADLLLRKK